MLFRNPMLLALGAFLTRGLAAPLIDHRPGDNGDNNCGDGPFGAMTQSEGRPWDQDEKAAVYFCVSKHKEGKAITGLTTWASPWSMVGLQVKYEDGTKSDVIGHQTENVKDMWWDHSTIKEFRTYRNMKGDAWGGYTGVSNVQGSNQIAHTHDGLNFKNNPGTKQQIYSGVLLAIRGRRVPPSAHAPDLKPEHQGNILTIDFRFLESNVRESKITKWEIDQGEFAAARADPAAHGVSFYTLHGEWYSNPNSKENQTYEFSKTITMTNSVTKSNSDSFSFGAAITLNYESTAGVPEVASVKTGINVETNFNYANETSKSNTNTQAVATTAKITSQLPPEMYAHCEMKTITGTYKGHYEQTQTLTFDNGGKWDIHSRGEFTSITWSEGFSSCRHYKKEDLPAEANGEKMKILG